MDSIFLIYVNIFLTLLEISMKENYFLDNTSESSKTKPNKQSVSMSTLIISIITTIVFVFIVINKWPNILDITGWQYEDKISNLDGFNVWDEFITTWTITDDWDIINYTHIVSSLEFGEIGIKSSTINLNNYSNEVYLEGIVEKIYQWMPVVSIDTIYSLDIVDELLSWDVLSWNDLQSQYLANMWLYFDTNFFFKYSLVNKWDGWTLKIKDIDTNQIINISYFKCTTSVNDQNCDRFNQMFTTSSSQKFVDSLWTTYYKQPDISSWFFSNDSLFGYFVNDTDDLVFKDIAKYITIINSKFVEKNILDNVDILCWDWGNAIKKVTEKNLYLKDNELYLSIKWNDWLELNLTCELKLDPTLKNIAKLVDLQVVGELKSQEDIQSENNWDVDVSYDWDMKVTQFPINPDKSLQFTSRRGHTFVFPSSNIAYVAQSTQEDFNQVGVNCFSVMNVVQYSEKEFVDQKWNVKVYECTAKNGVDDSDPKLIYKNIWDKHFVIEISDPAWVNFANNIEIKVAPTI